MGTRSNWDYWILIMANRRISDLTEIGSPDKANDYVMVMDVSETQLKKCLISSITAPDDDFYNNTTTVMQTTNADLLLIFDVSAGQYRKVSLGAFTAPELTALEAFFFGGQIGGGTYVVTADKFSIPSETASAKASADLSLARMNSASFTWENAEISYIVGGYAGAALGLNDKFSFGTEITSNLVAGLLYHPRYLANAGGDGHTKAFVIAGARPYAETEAEQFTFSGETFSLQASADMSQAKMGFAWVNYAAYSGYFLGGASAGPSYLSGCEKLTYTTDTMAIQSSADLTQARYQMSTNSTGDDNGYILGGYSGTAVNTAEKLVFATEITSVVASANLVTARYSMAGVSQGATYGYHTGGFDTGVSSVTERLVVATDTTAVLAGGSITSARQGLTGSSSLHF